MKKSIYGIHIPIAAYLVTIKILTSFPKKNVMSVQSQPTES